MWHLGSWHPESAAGLVQPPTAMVFPISSGPNSTGQCGLATTTKPAQEWPEKQARIDNSSDRVSVPMEELAWDWAGPSLIIEARTEGLWEVHQADGVWSFKSCELLGVASMDRTHCTQMLIWRIWRPGRHLELFVSGLIILQGFPAEHWIVTRGSNVIHLTCKSFKSFGWSMYSQVI